jgi:hypothetical protein
VSAWRYRAEVAWSAIVLLLIPVLFVGGALVGLLVRCVTWVARR